MQEIIAITQSLKQALNVMSEFAITGDWEATGKNENGIIYTRKGGNEEISIIKKGDRQWQLVKKITEKTS